ncbi:hypothetical protein CQ017_10690 [Arthrobacter sp. MYb224]|uniref:hypothetical protein n=1 Tax=Micrococcaceae TaxID=1268 RepID=UPI000CFBC47F|nr:MULTISPECIES: hypothetical protein [unclassified Arthrobacter]PQZ98085.1 hypothetical protein CQ017_10690 [Arthrobacter sp. MYb224]PRA02518.1 hypothetical protein CQ019_13750 [Arthrobacter sp. MYb229]PRB50539.1 hypothetical protein CQ013_11075 [Arthrobacter sp. MYb216]
MATIADIRVIAAALPQLEEGISGYGSGAKWSVPRGMVIWRRPLGKADTKRLVDQGQSVPQGEIYAVRTASEIAKKELIDAFGELFFDIQHLTGTDIVLFHLEHIKIDQLREVIIEGWLARVSSTTANAWRETLPGQ